MITDDVVGRPTEIRFFYKEEESDNYVVYFPNFNLTARDPGKYIYILFTAYEAMGFIKFFFNIKVWSAAPQTTL